MEPTQTLTSDSARQNGGADPEPPEQHERYAFRHFIDAGGNGEVWAVQDHVLQRTVAMKLLQRRHAAEPERLRRFYAEAQIASQLSHPAIVPIYDWGVMPKTGRPFLIMPIISGGSLWDVVEDSPAIDESVLRRRVGWVQLIADAIAYAHTQGAYHRDLKPANVVLEPFGSVRVLDWGLAASGRSSIVPASSGLSTIVGSGTSTQPSGVQGTPGYMAPEQARAASCDSVAVDVFGLGALLFAVMVGAPPYGRASKGAMSRTRRGEQPRIPQPERFPTPLVEICERALRPNPQERYENASQLSGLLRSWLERQDHLKRARVLVSAARDASAEAARHRHAASEASAAAAAMLSAVPSGAPEQARHAGWAAESLAQQHTASAAHADTRELQLFQSALTMAPGLAEAHAGLAAIYHAQHQAAERQGDSLAAARSEYLLRQHDRGRFAHYLRGIGALTLRASRPASVTLWRQELRNRRLHSIQHAAPCPLPLVDLELPIGSYIAEIRADDGVCVRYPFVIERTVTTQVEVAPTVPGALWLPRAGQIPGGMVYVPGGMYWSGGDRAVPGVPLPLRRVWVDGFFMARFPVTNRDYLQFVNALLAAGDAESAAAHCPRQRGGALIGYGRPDGGPYRLVPDPEGEVWDLDWPVFYLDRDRVRAYARWKGQQLGLPLRLPWELEWEKAARGADQRVCVWGSDTVEPSWCQHALSLTKGLSRPAVVGACPIDESVYGVRDLAGSIGDWCEDLYHPDGPRIDDSGRWRPQPIDNGIYTIRGGHWNAPPARARLCWRGGAEGRNRTHLTGFRLVVSAEAIQEP